MLVMVTLRSMLGVSSGPDIQVHYMWAKMQDTVEHVFRHVMDSETLYQIMLFTCIALNSCQEFF